MIGAQNHGKKLAEEKIDRHKSFRTEHFYEQKNLVVLPEPYDIDANLKYKKGLLHELKKYTLTFENEYEFKQYFPVETKEGIVERSANAIIYIQEKKEDMNISSFSMPEPGYNGGPAISYYNNKGTLVASIQFKNKNDSDAFMNRYYNRIWKLIHNPIIKAYKQKNGIK